MRIVFTIKSINLAGGSERSTSTIANALVARGHEVAIVSYVGSDMQPFFPIDERIKLYYIAPQRERYPVLIREIRRICKLRQLYALIRPDVIVVIGTTRAWVNVPATRGYKVVAKEYFSVHHRSQLLSWFSRRLTASTANAIVALSEEDKRIYLQRLGAKRVEIIFNPLTLKNPTPSQLDKKIVLGLGRMTYVKGFDLLLDAWKQVKHTDWCLHLVGDGKMRKKLVKRVIQEKIPNVYFFPATADVLPHYMAASLFVLPSRSEAFGNVLTEAMSVGIPTISFDCGEGPRSIVEENVTGIIVPAQDTQAMANALDTLMNDSARLQAMSIASLNRAKCYDTEVVMMQWEKIFEEVIRD